MILGSSVFLKALVLWNIYLKGDGLKNAKCTLYNFSKTGSACRCKKHLLCFKFTNSFNSVVRWADITMHLSLEGLHLRERMEDCIAQIRATLGCEHFGKCVKGRSLRFSMVLKYCTKCNVVSYNGSWNKQANKQKQKNNTSLVEKLVISE